jgi:hypothetical protein
MKKITFTLISFALSSVSAFAQMSQGQIAIGGTNMDQANSIIQTKDGGYAVAGMTSSFGPGTYQAYVVNFDKKGNLKWAEAIGGTGLDEGYSIVQSSDGGFAVTGFTNSYAAGTEEVWLIKLDSNGHKKWTESIGGTGADQGRCIINTKDGGYAIGGYTSSYGHGGPSVFYIIKVTSTGVLQWTQTVGGTGDQEATCIVQANDGGYALAGYTLSYGAGNADVYVVKVDSLGALDWTTTIGGPLGDAGYSICQTSDHGYAVTGYTSSYGAGGDDVYLIKLDSAGALKWTETIGGSKSDIGYSVIENKEGDLVIAGSTASYVTNETVVYLIKTTSTGSVLWTRTIGQDSPNYAYDLIQTTDGGYAIAGYTTSGAGAGDFYIVKFDSSGNACDPSLAGGGTVGTGGTASSGGSVVSGGVVNYQDSGMVTIADSLDTLCRHISTTAIENIKSSLNEVKLYPNPNDGSFTLAVVNCSQRCNVEIFNILGEEVFTGALSSAQGNNGINISSQPSGVYFYRVLTDTGSLIGEGKVIVQK